MAADKSDIETRLKVAETALSQSLAPLNLGIDAQLQASFRKLALDLASVVDPLRETINNINASHDALNSSLLKTINNLKTPGAELFNSINSLSPISPSLSLNIPDFSSYVANAAAAHALADNLSQLQEARVRSLGKSGTVSTAAKLAPKLSEDTERKLAKYVNGARAGLERLGKQRQAELEAAVLDARLASERLDMSLPVAPAPQGSVHPVSQVMDELAEIFADLGFAVATGPEIEDDWHNFTALNIPETHPARAMHDTFYFDQVDGEGRRMLLRTHTSPVQIRTMTSQKPPIRIIAPGRTYRSDSDATHTPMFHQVEGLVIDRGIHMGHLKWTLETFVKAYFERDDIVLRLRPSYFPFTEPSAEVDVGYTRDKDGRRVIGGAEPDGWMEILGSGMVHPKVIAACGLDPAEWQGFAFGCGIDRLAMLKYGMDDLRAFFDGDLRWLKHYGFAALDVPTLSGGVGA
jgi:phenylalanyl-tRNA synthetase alpha chain